MELATHPTIPKPGKHKRNLCNPSTCYNMQKDEIHFWQRYLPCMQAYKTPRHYQVIRMYQTTEDVQSDSHMIVQLVVNNMKAIQTVTDLEPTRLDIKRLVLSIGLASLINKQDNLTYVTDRCFFAHTKRQENGTWSSPTTRTFRSKR